MIPHTFIASLVPNPAALAGKAISRQAAMRSAAQPTNCMDVQRPVRHQARRTGFLLTGLLATSQALTFGGTQATTIQEFTSHPPAMQLVGECRYHSLRTGPRSDFVLIRWQPGACLFRCSDSIEGLKQPLRRESLSVYLLCGRYDTNYWSITSDPIGGSVLLCRYLPVIGGSPDAGGGHKLIAPGESWAAAYMNLGIEVGGIGELRWQGDRFCVTNGMDSVVSGTLHAEAGRAERLEYLIHRLPAKLPKGAPRDIHWRLRYRYREGSAADALPCQIDHYHVGLDGTESPTKSYVIHELQIPGTNFPSEAFAPEPVIGNSLRVVPCVISNGTTFVKWDDKGFSPMPKAVEQPVRRPKLPIYLTLAGTLVLLPALLFLLSRRK
jgi:hypothetical protein